MNKMSYKVITKHIVLNNQFLNLNHKIFVYRMLLVTQHFKLGLEKYTHYIRYFSKKIGPFLNGLQYQLVYTFFNVCQLTFLLSNQLRIRPSEYTDEHAMICSS